MTDIEYTSRGISTDKELPPLEKIVFVRTNAGWCKAARFLHAPGRWLWGLLFYEPRQPGLVKRFDFSKNLDVIEWEEL